MRLLLLMTIAKTTALTTSSSALLSPFGVGKVQYRHRRSTTADNVAPLRQQQLSTVDDDGNNPLHIELRDGRSEKNLLDIIENNPDAAKHRNKFGKYPLHFASYYDHPLSVVTVIYDLYKPAIKERDRGWSDSLTPLQLALKRVPRSEDVVLKLCHEFPQAASICSRYKRYPLHTACRYEHSDKVVFELLHYFPEATKLPDNWQVYPLHLACEYKQSEKVVLKLLQEFPLAANQVIRRGNISLKGQGSAFPLHLAIERRHSENVVLSLLRQFPLAAKHDDGGWFGYPLHLACMHNQSEKVVLQLLHEFPQAAKEKNDSGYYPLRLAYDYNQSEKVILTLINLHLEAVKNVRLNIVEVGQCQSATIRRVIEELRAKSDYDLYCRTGIPEIVTSHGLNNK